MTPDLDERIRSTVHTVARTARDPHPFPASVPRNTPTPIEPATRRRNAWLAIVAATTVLAIAVTVLVIREQKSGRPSHRNATTTTLPPGDVQYLRLRYTQRLDVRCARGDQLLSLGRFDSALVEVWRARDRVRQRVTYPDGSTRDSIVLKGVPGPTHFGRGIGLAMRSAKCGDTIRGVMGDEPGWYSGWSAPQVINPAWAEHKRHRGHDRRGRPATIHSVTSRGFGCEAPSAPLPAVGSTSRVECSDIPGATSYPTVTTKTWFVAPRTGVPLEIRRVERVGRVATATSWLILDRAEVTRLDTEVFSTSGYQATPSTGRS